MRKVTREEILRGIWSSKGNAIQSWVAEGRMYISYSFDRFLKDMLKSGILSDRRTIQTKWEMLIATGVVREIGRNQCQLAFLPFIQFMDRFSADLLRSTVSANGGERVRESEREMCSARVVG